MVDHAKLISELHEAMAAVDALPDKNALLNMDMDDPERSTVEAAFVRLEKAEAAWREAGSPTAS